MKSSNSYLHGMSHKVCALIVAAAVNVFCCSQIMANEDTPLAPDQYLPSDHWVLVWQNVKLRNIVSMSATMGGVAIASVQTAVGWYPYFIRDPNGEDPSAMDFNVQFGIADSGWWKVVDVVFKEAHGNIYARRRWTNYGTMVDFVTDKGKYEYGHYESDSVYALSNFTYVRGEENESILNVTTNMFGASWPVEYDTDYVCCKGLTLDQLYELAVAGCVQGFMGGPYISRSGDSVCCFPVIETNDGRRELILQFQMADYGLIKCVVMKFFEDSEDKDVIRCSRLWRDYNGGTVGAFDFYNNVGIYREANKGYDIERLKVVSPYEIPKRKGFVVELN